MKTPVTTRIRRAQWPVRWAVRRPSRSRSLSMNTENSMDAHEHHHEHWKPKRSVRDYLPLIVIVAIALLSALANQWTQETWDGRVWMRQFMGTFLVIFAMFKLFDLQGFAEGFQMYDLIAKR